jgi:hypothetical protein
MRAANGGSELSSDSVTTLPLMAGGSRIGHIVIDNALAMEAVRSLTYCGPPIHKLSGPSQRRIFGSAMRFVHAMLKDASEGMVENAVHYAVDVSLGRKSPKLRIRLRRGRRRIAIPEDLRRVHGQLKPRLAVLCAEFKKHRNRAHAWKRFEASDPNFAAELTGEGFKAEWISHADARLLTPTQLTDEVLAKTYNLTLATVQKRRRQRSLKQGTKAGLK